MTISSKPTCTILQYGKVFISQPKSGPGLWGFETVKFANTPPSGESNHYVLGFGKGRKGEVYVLTTDKKGPTGHTGKVYKMF